MPKQLSKDEVEAAVIKAIFETGADSMKDMGKLMGVLKSQLDGKADMGVVSQLIKAKTKLVLVIHTGYYFFHNDKG